MLTKFSGAKYAKNGICFIVKGSFTSNIRIWCKSDDYLWFTYNSWCRIKQNW